MSAGIFQSGVSIPLFVLLKKLVKVFPHTSFLETENNRNVFTNHGLHLNKTGKRLVTYQIASLLHSIFEHKISVPIILGWHNEYKIKISQSVKETKLNYPSGILVANKIYQ
jgi:hypothetical protein